MTYTNVINQKLKCCQWAILETRAYGNSDYSYMLHTKRYTLQAYIIYMTLQNQENCINTKCQNC